MLQVHSSLKLISYSAQLWNCSLQNWNKMYFVMSQGKNTIHVKKLCHTFYVAPKVRADKTVLIALSSTSIHEAGRRHRFQSQLNWDFPGFSCQFFQMHLTYKDYFSTIWSSSYWRISFHCKNYCKWLLLFYNSTHFALSKLYQKYENLSCKFINKCVYHMTRPLSGSPVENHSEMCRTEWVDVSQSIKRPFGSASPA